MSHQSIVQNQLAQRRVKQIRDRMAMQVDHEYATPRDPAHLTKNLDHLLVNKVVREQRTDHIIKLRIRERQLQRIATNAADAFSVDRLRGTLIQLKPNAMKLSLRLPRPNSSDAQQLSGTSANVEHRKAAQRLRFNLTKQRGP